MPSSVTIFNVTKFRPGQHTITLASAIFIATNPSPSELEWRQCSRARVPQSARSLPPSWQVVINSGVPLRFTIHIRTRPVNLRHITGVAAFLLIAFATASGSRAENGYDAWLRYAPLAKS